MTPVRPLAAGELVTEPGVYVMPIERHHDQPCDGPSITSSRLRTIFTDSPMSYWITSPLNPRRVEEPDKVDWLIGRAVHHVALGEAGFRDRFAVMPDDVYEASGKGSRTARDGWKADRVAEGRHVLIPPQLEAIRGMAGLLPWQEGIEDCGLANNAMVRGGILSGLIEHTIAFRDKETGIWLLARPDAIPTTSTDAGDLKTTKSVDYESLQRTIGDLRYDIQAALVRMAMREVMDVDLTGFALVFVAKTPPYAVEVREIKTSEINEGEKDLRVALRTFARCLETGRWPGPGGQRRDAAYVERTPYARTRAEERRRSLQEELAR